MSGWRIALLIAAGTAAAPERAAAQVAPPAGMIGTFADDYGSSHTVTPGEWTHHPRIRYRIVQWDTTRQFILARVARPGSDSLGPWVRIDWMRFDGMPPWNWGFCLAIWDAPTRAAALAAPQSDRLEPRKGCGRFPFTRMARWSEREAAARPGQPPGYRQ